MKIKRGSTSVRRLIFIADSSSATGAGLANLAWNTSGLVAYYFAGDLNNEVQITLASATLGSYTSGGFVAVDNTNMPGWYEVGIPDAALDGGNEVAIQYRGAANMVPVNVYIELDAVDYQSATNFGLSKFADIETDTQDIQSRIPTALVGGRMDSVSADTGTVATNVQAIKAKTDQLAFTVANQVDANSLTGGLTQAQIRTAVGLAAANLDTQLGAIDDYLDNEIAAIKAKTDLITSGNISVLQDRVNDNTITMQFNENTSATVNLDEDTTSATLQFVVASPDGTDVLIIANGSITRTSADFTVTITTAVTATIGQYLWSLRDLSAGGNRVITKGVLTVQNAASIDA